MKKRSNLLTFIILGAMLVGIGIGYIVFKTVPDPETRKAFATNAKLLTTIFMGLVKMIIAPLVFATLVVGISKLGDMKTVGRVGGKAMAWFITASLLSLLIGMFWVNVLAPGVGSTLKSDLEALSAAKTDSTKVDSSKIASAPSQPMAMDTTKMDSGGGAMLAAENPAKLDSGGGAMVAATNPAMGEDSIGNGSAAQPVASTIDFKVDSTGKGLTAMATSAHDSTKAEKDAAKIIKDNKKFSFQTFIEHLVPTSIVQSMATNEILQIVIFSIFFGVACAAIGDRAKPIIEALDSLAHIILKMVGYVMNFAPLGVLGAISAVVAENGLESIVGLYLKYFGAFLVGIASLWVLLLTVGYLILGKRLSLLLKGIMNPMAIAFSTTSSEAVFPKMVEELERFGCNNKIVAFILPLGYSFNLDGSMMYMTFASIFIAQVNGVHLDIGTQLTMLLVLMLTSKGIAGVPRASLVVVTATCAMFGIPAEGIALILPIDHFCDMFRSMTNVVGNALATSAVSKWEGELGPPHEIRDTEQL